ncbi:SIR2 family protein [Vibrio sp. Isolate32]|uniref:SIR2 family protein n=1 Tax=Vibrio sp. Isolate32 TaxID=2908538 RepID=UPI001EFE4E92|nr:SIR2 family protein [Vibrio sp. Isolate32]MCG9552664.1 SIR2 family protein [Vibrio sp. Isolate32]
MSQIFKPQKHLINILKNTQNHHPNFTLFLGAGASVTSKVKPAGELIKEWRQAYSDMYDCESEKLEDQYWYGKHQEYSVLFEKLYDQPSQRREFIETCIDNAKPSWGYIYLVNLLKNKHFNTIFTTNFDDLVNEACYTFSDSLRPIVCAHDSSINSVRLTSERPKIIKLHGDFLFDNIKNTVRELESLESNMREKFKQYASEFGLIVVGYAGNDRSVMDTLNTLLFTGEHFPHGVYWCVREDTKFEDLSEPLKALSRFPNFHLVKIDGFDEFFAQIHQALDCDLQQEVSDPYNALVKKLNKTFNNDSSYDAINDADLSPGQTIIQRDYSRLVEQLSEIGTATKLRKQLSDALKALDEDILDKINTAFESMDDQTFKTSMQDFLDIVKANGGRPLMPVPNYLLARNYFKEEKYNEAITYALDAIKEDQNAYPTPLAIDSMVNLNDFTLFDVLIDTIKGLKINDRSFSSILDSVVELTSQNMLNEARITLDLIRSFNTKAAHRRYIVLNSMLIEILDKGDKVHFSEAEIDRLIIEFQSSVENSSDPWGSLGLAIICNHLNIVEDISFIIDSTDTEALSHLLDSNMPIKRLISEELSATMRSSLEKRNIGVNNEPN